MTGSGTTSQISKGDKAMSVSGPWTLHFSWGCTSNYGQLPVTFNPNGTFSGNLTGKWVHVLLIAVPILIQVYFNSGLAYLLMRLFGVEYRVAAPGALIGASNFFELAVATSIALFGPGSGAALATVVGVLIEVPVMLSVCGMCNRTRHWFAGETAGELQLNS